MDAMMSSGEASPASIAKLVELGVTEEALLAPRPLVTSPSSRPTEVERSQHCNTPLSIGVRGDPLTPSPSNGRDEGPRRRNGSSVTVIAADATCCPILSRRKLVFRATEVPLTAAAKLPAIPRATRGSYTTG